MLDYNARFSVHLSRFSLLSLRGFTKSSNGTIKPVVRGRINGSEFFLMILKMFVKRTMGWTNKGLFT